MSTPSSPSWKLLTALLLLLSFVPIAAGAVRVLRVAAGGELTPDNARFIAMPAPVVLHIVGAAIFCVLGAFQFDLALRRQHPRLHRIGGRLAAACGLVAALTGLWMTAEYDIPAAMQGQLLFGVRIAVGLAMTLALVLAVRAVLQRRMAEHQAWMVRAYALGQGAGTQVLILLPVTVLVGAPTFLLRDVLMALAWGLNVAVAEWLIRRRRRPTARL